MFSLIFCRDTVDIWKTLGGEPTLVPEVLDHLVNLLNITLPYQEKVAKDNSKTRTATVLAMSVCSYFYPFNCFIRPAIKAYAFFSHW